MCGVEVHGVGVRGVGVRGVGICGVGVRSVGVCRVGVCGVGECAMDGKTAGLAYQTLNVAWRENQHMMRGKTKMVDIDAP